MHPNFKKDVKKIKVLKVGHTLDFMVNKKRPKFLIDEAFEDHCCQMESCNSIQSFHLKKFFALISH